jgi:hypothetical protein
MAFTIKSVSAREERGQSGAKTHIFSRRLTRRCSAVLPRCRNASRDLVKVWERAVVVQGGGRYTPVKREIRRYA